jgi:hypothetical protein
VPPEIRETIPGLPGGNVTTREPITAGRTAQFCPPTVAADPSKANHIVDAPSTLTTSTAVPAGDTVTVSTTLAARVAVAETCPAVIVEAVTGSA